MPTTNDEKVQDGHKVSENSTAAPRCFKKSHKLTRYTLCDNNQQILQQMGTHYHQPKQPDDDSIENYVHMTNWYVEEGHLPLHDCTFDKNTTLIGSLVPSPSAPQESPPIKVVFKNLSGTPIEYDFTKIHRGWWFKVRLHAKDVYYVHLDNYDGRKNSDTSEDPFHNHRCIDNLASILLDYVFTPSDGAKSHDSTLQEVIQTCHEYVEKAKLSLPPKSNTLLSLPTTFNKLLKSHGRNLARYLMMAKNNGLSKKSKFIEQLFKNSLKAQMTHAEEVKCCDSLEAIIRAESSTPDAGSKRKASSSEPSNKRQKRTPRVVALQEPHGKYTLLISSFAPTNTYCNKHSSEGRRFNDGY